MVQKSVTVGRAEPRASWCLCASASKVIGEWREIDAAEEEVGSHILRLARGPCRGWPFQVFCLRAE